MSGFWEQLDPKNRRAYISGATLDKFEAGDILVTVNGGALYGTQYYYNGITLTIVDNDPSVNDDGQCQKAKLEGELFMKLASAVPNDLEIDTYREGITSIIKLIKGNGLYLSKKDADRIEKLKNSEDLETVILGYNILKERYYVDIQREGIQA